MLALLHATTGLVNTYPVKSINLAQAQSPQFFEAIDSATIGVEDAASCYGVATSDGGYVVVGGGLESETSVNNEAFAMKLSSTGSRLWSWSGSNLNALDTSIGCTQLPNGGDILVVGYRSEGGDVKRSLTKLSLTTGSQIWQATNFGDSAGSYGGWETIDVTADGSAVLISGWMNKPDTTELGYRSGGNTFGGQAVVMQIPVSALTNAPTSADATWTKSFPGHHAAHAARSLSSGEVGVLLWTDEDPGVATGAVSGSAALTKLSATGTIVWGPINYGGTQGLEGTDLQISTDGTKFVISGHGTCSGSAMLCGKAVSVAASDGAVSWASEFASCGVPNECGMTLIKNECWGLQALSDGYVLACGTGIEDCNG